MQRDLSVAVGQANAARTKCATLQRTVDECRKFLLVFVGFGGGWLVSVGFSCSFSFFYLYLVVLLGTFLCGTQNEN
jgi:hypothetical protein